MNSTKRPGRSAALIALLAIAVLSAALPGCAKAPVAINPEPSVETSLEPVHPDEPVATTYNERFSLDNALGRIGQLREAAPDSGEAAMAHNNWLGAIEGTLRKAEYEARKAEFELAKVQLRDKQITPEAYDQKQSAFKKAEADFVAFWGTFGISD